MQKKLEKLDLPVVWEKPEKLHLTLNFIGVVQDREMSKVLQGLDKTISGFPPITLRPQFLETLYNRHEPSLIYYMPTGDVDKLKDLQARTTQLLNSIDFPQRSRFLPHLTIGRFKRTEPTFTKYAMDQVAKQEMPGLSEFTVDRITLFNSLVSRAGSQYARMGEFTLA